MRGGAARSAIGADLDMSRLREEGRKVGIRRAICAVSVFAAASNSLAEHRATVKTNY
jgi:hypothetical protein